MVLPRAIVLLFGLSHLEMVHPLQRNVRQVSTAVSRNVSTIPLARSFYSGTDGLPIDDCPRDEVKLPDGHCYQLLTQGPCATTEFVVLNTTTLRGICAPRLCAPDRIFIFSDQLCHDPRDPLLCPEGRQLYQTSYGTPVCQCPEGTYESDDDDLEERGCEPMLTAASSCLPGQVLWFRNIRSPRECLPDPCGGENLRRSQQQHLLVPSAGDGKCYPVGQTGGICPRGTWYTLDFSQLQGVCSTLEDSGYLVLDEKQLADFEELYGPFIPKMEGEILFERFNATPINPSFPARVSIESAVRGSFFPLEQFRPAQSQHQVLPPSESVIISPSLLPPQQIPLFKENPDRESQIIGISLSHSPLLLAPLTSDKTPVESERQQVPVRKSKMGPIIHFPSTSKHLKSSNIRLAKGRLATETRVSGPVDGVFSSQTSHDISIPIAHRFSATVSDTKFADTVSKILDAMSILMRKKRSDESHSNRQGQIKKKRVPRGIPLLHFTPGNIFDTRLVACRAGAQRDANAKCRDTILPPRAPAKLPPVPPRISSGAPPSSPLTPQKEAGRQSRSTPPAKPQPPCPPGEAFNIQRQCGSLTSVANSIMPDKIG